MRIKPTRQQLEASPTLQAASLAKAIAIVDFPEGTFTHSEIQYCLNNNIEISGIRLYSPALPENQINSEVPVAWPNSAKPEGGQKTWAEYTKVFPVTGGFSVLFHGGFYDENENHNLPTFDQLKLWISRAGDFITPGELDAIKL